MSHMLNTILDIRNIALSEGNLYGGYLFLIGKNGN